MVDLFQGLSDPEIERLAEAMKERSFPEGDVILAEGEGGVGFFVISEETVRYSVNGRDVGSGGAGDYFGEVALLNEGPRAATVTAATDVTVYGLMRWEFRALVEENADIASRLRQVMAKRQGAES
jgi:CRP/FNR family transcriptional regulator